MSDYNSRYLVPTFNGLVAQIGLSAGVSVVCLGIFEWNRRKKTLQYLYSPRCRLKVYVYLVWFDCILHIVASTNNSTWQRIYHLKSLTL